MSDSWLMNVLWFAGEEYSLLQNVHKQSDVMIFGVLFAIVDKYFTRYKILLTYHGTEGYLTI